MGYDSNININKVNYVSNPLSNGIIVSYNILLVVLS